MSRATLRLNEELDQSDSEDSALGLAPLDLSRQTKNLLLARPLHELAAKVRRMDYADGDFRDVDTNLLALSLFDYIMEGSVFGLGRLREEVVTYLSDIVRQMKGETLAFERCNELAVEVLNTLHNGENRNEQFDFPYYDSASRQMKRYRFSLLAFQRQDDNQYKYRLTDAAILLYIGQLDIGAEQMQTLLDRMLAELVKRGRVNEALDVSRQAYLQAVRYQDNIRGRLDRAQRVPDAVHWKKDLAPFLENARTHIDERGREGRLLLALVKEKINATSDLPTRERLVRLRETVELESAIHLNLLKQVAEAGERYLTASRTMFRARRRHNLPDLEEAVLPSLLRQTQAELSELCGHAGYAFLPPSIDHVFNLRQVLELLTQPVAESPPESDEPDVVVPIPKEMPYFDAADIELADGYLRRVFADRMPRYIDEILEFAIRDQLAPSVCDYMVFRLYQSFSREEDAFGVLASADGRFRLPQWEGSRLHFTHRDTNEQ